MLQGGEEEVGAEKEGAAVNEFATLQAQAAAAGYTLHTDPQGGYFVMRWGLMRLFDTLQEVAQWLEMVTGRAAA